MRIALSLTILLATTTPSLADTRPHVRGVSPKESQMIEHLLAASETARGLADEIDASDLIVYVELTPSLIAGRGATRFVTTTGGFRFLRVVIGATTPLGDRGALLGHELQHAAEIARAPEVQNDDALRRLYERIGEDRQARFSFETAAAREVGQRVRRELLLRRAAAATAPAPAM